MKSDWESTWQRIVSLQGETFLQKQGRPFTYRVDGGGVHPSTTNRMLPRSHFEKAFDLMPIDGPGEIQHLQGPSYIWAILRDERVFGAATPVTSPVGARPAVRGSVESAVFEVPGFPVGSDELESLGFTPHELELLEPVDLSFGQRGVDWNTVGEIPDSPGLYLFTVGEDPDVRVLYVGLTTNLWMVTKGRLPKGGARGGQRYGRPRHAGVTRQRVNVEVARQVAAGRHVRHWVKPVENSEELPQLEAELIGRWNLRLAGWNRG